MTTTTAFSTKFLVLDGIGGVPLGRELTESLRAIGHAAFHFDCLKQQERTLYGIRSAYSKAINRRRDGDGFHLLPRLSQQTFQTLIENEAPTHILVVGFAYKFFDPRALRRIADTHGIALILYDTDSCNLYGKRREFIFFIENELPVYDRIFSFSRITTRFFSDTRGLPATHLPFAANPVAMPADERKTIDALFVGSGDLRRILALEAIRENVTIYGHRWARNFPLISRKLQQRITDKPVWGSELVALQTRAKIVLNITRSDFFGAETGINLRIFEAVAAGSFLLTDYCEEIEDVFAIGSEVEVFRSSSELAEKTFHFLTHDEERESIARRGRERFLRDHTWTRRVAQLVQLLGIPSDSFYHDSSR